MEGKIIMPSNVKPVTQFLYMEYEDENVKKVYDWITTIRLLDLHCKHIMNMNNHNKDIYDAAEKAFNAQGVRNRVIWGVNRNGTIESETAIIKKMVADNFDRPVRIFIDQFERVWADNTHSVISWIIRRGFNCTLNDIPFYMVDLREDIPRIISVNATVHDSVKDIQMAIGCAYRIKDLIKLGYRSYDLNWSINDLMNDIHLI